MACEAKDADDGQSLFCDADGSPIETGLTAKKLNGWVPERSVETCVTEWVWWCCWCESRDETSC